MRLHYRTDSTQMHNLITDGSREQQSIRSKRAKKPRTPGAAAIVKEPDQRLDNDQPEVEQPVIPKGFLSPSVKEYLELGKSIPGKNFPLLTINFNLTKIAGGPDGERDGECSRANKL